MRNLKEILTGKKRKMNFSHSEKNVHNHLHNGDNLSGIRYQCPMKCEGEKTYEKPVNCPVCNMHLSAI